MKSKRIMTGIIAGIMVTASMPCCMNMINNPVVIADAVSTEGGLTYTKCYDHIKITDCDESVVSVAIAGCAFANCYNLKEITIPDSITSIGYSAFGGCTGLT